MSTPNLVLETHLHSTAAAWSRSFHLRLPHPATKSHILSLVRASLARLGLASPVVEAQITLYFTLHGRVLSLPGTPAAAVTTSTISVPVYNPPQILAISQQQLQLQQYQQQQQQQQLGWPLALTYANGINHLHAYGPSPLFQPPQQTMTTTTTLVNPGGLGFLNINLNVPSPLGGGGGNRPVVSDVVRETRLDAVAEGALAGLLDWALGPNGLKLVLLVDVDGRDVLPAVVALPEPEPEPEPAAPSPPAPATPAAPAPATPPPPAASDAEAAAAE